MNFFYANGTPIINSLKVTSEVPLDPRLTVENIAERDSLVTNHISYDRMKVYVKSNDTKYIYHKDTGEWEIDNKFSEEDKSKLDKIDNYLIDTEHIYNPENKLLYREHSYDPNTDITTLRDHILQEARVSENGELYNGLLSKFYVKRLNNITNYLIDVSFTKGTDVPNLYLTTHSYNPDEDKTTLTNIDIPLATDDNHGLLSNLQNIKVNRIVDYVNRIDTTHTNAPDTGLTYNYNIYNPFTNANVTKTILIPLVTHTENGLTSSSDKIKIDDIETYVKSIALRQASGTEELGIDYIITNPNDQTDTPGYFNIPLVTDSRNGLVSPARKHWMDNASGVSNTGTTSDTWQLDKKDIDTRLDPNGGVIIKDSGGIAEIRNNTDSAYSDLTLNNITIKGNVTQEGKSFITEAETVEVRDNTLLLNRGETGAGVSREFAGIEIDRGTEPKYQILFDESDDRFKVGKEGDLWCVTLRDDEADMEDGMFTTWDASTKRLKTTNIVPANRNITFANGKDDGWSYSLKINENSGYLSIETFWHTLELDLLGSDFAAFDLTKVTSNHRKFKFLKPIISDTIECTDSNYIEFYSPNHMGRDRELVLQLGYSKTRFAVSVYGTTFYRTSDNSEVLYHADIVNNLTSGGVNKVLSAEQGKLLNNAIEDIRGTYLPLTGGTMSGSIRFPVGLGIVCEDVSGSAAYGVLRTWNYNGSTRMYVGTVNFPTYISSTASDLIHDRNGSSYLLWDNFNLPDPARLGVDQTFTGLNTFTKKTIIGNTVSPQILLDPANEIKYRYASTEVSRGYTIALGNNNNIREFTFGGYYSASKSSEYAYLSLPGQEWDTSTYKFYANSLRVPYQWSIDGPDGAAIIWSQTSEIVNLGRAAGTTKIRSGNTDLIHTKGSTEYIIWDKYNLTNPVRYTLDASGYPNFQDVDGNNFSYIKAGISGIIPNSAVSLSSKGIGNIGTNGWSFAGGYINHLHTNRITFGETGPFIDAQAGDSSRLGIGFYNSNNGALSVYMGSLCISDSYAADGQYKPTNGIYSKGSIRTGSAILFVNNTWSNNLAANRNSVGYLQVLDAYNASSDGGPTNYGTVLQINSRIDHWANQLWFGSNDNMYLRRMNYGSTTYGEWNRLLTNKDVNIIPTQSASNPSSLPVNQIFYSEIQGVTGTPTTQGALFSVQGDDEGIQLWASSSRNGLYYRTKWTSFGNWIKLATTSDLGNYLPLSGGTLSGNLTINTVGSTTLVINNNDTNGFETYMRVLRKGTQQAAIGFMDGLGAYIYNYNSNKYLFIADDGYARVGTTSGSTRLALITDIPTVSGYLPLSGGTMSGNISFNGNTGHIVVGANETSNYVNAISYNKGSATNSAQIGYHSTGGTIDGTGALILVPYSATNSPWSKAVGLYIAKNELLLDGKAIATQEYVTSRGYLTSVSWNNITGKPNTYTPSAHSHDRLQIEDNRDVTMFPNNMGPTTLRTFFNSNNMPTSDWYSGIHINGWTTTYAAWELCGPSSNNTTTASSLYFRSGKDSTWNSWKKIAFTSDIPTMYERTIGINGTYWSFYAPTNATSAMIYGPTSAGTSGQILQSTGGVPTWVNASSVVGNFVSKSGDTMTGALTMNSRRNNIVVDVVGGAGNSWDEGAGALSIQVPNDSGQTPLILARRSGAAINTKVATERLLSMELLDTGHSFIIGMSGSEALQLDWTSGKAGTGKLFGKTIATTDQIPSLSGYATTSDLNSLSDSVISVTTGTNYIPVNLPAAVKTSAGAKKYLEWYDEGPGWYNFRLGYIDANGTISATGNVTAPKFIGALQGNADTATTASKLGSTTIGGSAKPIYLSSGTPTACSATVGSATVPVYMNAGTITQCSTTLGVSITGTAATATKWNGYSIWTGTEDELPSSRDANTLYFVKKS